MKQEFTTTGDGSHSLYVRELDEHYHSRHGAIREANHVYIDRGMKSINANDHISILEIGFGTGLNALLTLLKKGPLSVRYVTIEKYPLQEEVWSKLNYPTLIDAPGVRMKFEQLHKAEWGRPVEVEKNFTLHKIREDFRRFSVDGFFDVIYFDAFAPDIQPDLWSNEVLERTYAQTKPGGILVTYSAKGDVRRGLQHVGYEVERLPGPPGKKHMTRAKK